MELQDFRNRIQEELAHSKTIKSVQVSGRTLNDALKQASVELSLPVTMLDYEILTAQRFGFLGFHRSPCQIIAYKMLRHASEDEENIHDALPGDAHTDLPQMHEIHGHLSIRLSLDGAWVKVFPPDQGGVAVSMDEAIDALTKRAVGKIDTGILETAVKRADKMWIKAGEFYHNPLNDSTVSIEVPYGDIEAFITVTAPGPGGYDFSSKDLKRFLKDNKICYGIKEKILQDFEDSPVYDTSILVAEGDAAKNGDNARIECHFETHPERIRIQENEDGSVDFKELNRYQNVTEGQAVATKMAPKSGEDGRTVYGKMLMAQDGKDIDFEIGKNVVLSEDGLTAIATISGHVLIKSGIISVEDILIIHGNVDVHTGNVNVLGSVAIKGNVEDGFSVSAEGNIEVSGYVGKANLSAGGDIFVSGGINGGEGSNIGQITSSKSIWSSFIQNSHTKAGEFVIVSSGILNSHVIAGKKILCQGYRARIIGGHIRAAEEINAVTLGAPGGTQTIVEVGFDPDVKDEIQNLQDKHRVLSTQMEKIISNLRGLKRLAETNKSQYTKEKARIHKQLHSKYGILNKQLEAIDADIKERMQYMDTLSSDSRISSSKEIFPGVHIIIRDVKYVVKEGYTHPVSFLSQGNSIGTTKYNEIEEELGWR